MSGNERGASHTGQVAAYYTGEDISSYIARSSIVPAIFDRAEEHCPKAFAADGPIWPMLRRDPERYIQADLGHGVALDLPPAVAAGLGVVAQRTLWNSPAPAAYALPTETWREVIARRQRHAEIHAALANGQCCCVNEAISANLRLDRLLDDLLATTTDAPVLLAFWQSLNMLTVLDPTCGEGAFLLAALDLLRPLYLRCLERMATLAQTTATDAFDHVLQAASQPNWDAFVVGAIMGNNLYGVDLVAEAVASCKARLRAYVGTQCAQPPVGSALQSALDAHILLGNALVGSLASAAEIPAQELDRALAALYAVDRHNDPAFAHWRERHQPLHWGLAFPTVMGERGGFDVVLGNPPYLAYARVRPWYSVRGYATERCANLYAFVIERSLAVLRAGGRLGMIVPIAALATSAMEPLQQLYVGYWQWHSHWAVRPGRLFAGVDMNLTITLLHKQAAADRCLSTGYRRWSSGRTGDRAQLFTTLAYTPIPQPPRAYPKLGSALEVQLLARLERHGRSLGQYSDPAGVALFYHSGGRYWRKALLAKLSSHYRPFRVPAPLVPVVFALLNSQLFYWYWISHSNCMDLVAREVRELPVFALETAPPALFAEPMARLLDAYAAGKRSHTRRGAQINGTEIHIAVAKAKPIIDELDRLLAACYGLSEEELDFVLNYDAKYRFGRG